MDQPTIYKNQSSPGLYYIESANYFPLRGNGWYLFPTVDYCLKNNIIQKSDIKYVVLSSLSIQPDHYNEFVDYLYSNVEEAKLSVNAMIGNFKPKPRESWRSRCIVETANEAYNYFLNYKGAFIDYRQIANKDYYQVYETSMTTKEETEAVIYQQILESEAIELHKMKTLIEANNGICLDLNTDCISCIFPNNVFPFELENENIKGYYYDKEKKFHKYKLEEKKTRLECPKLANYKRNDKYDHKAQPWNIINDVENNDFTPLINQILDSKKSCNIDGRAGTGKSTFIKMLQSEMKNRGITFRSLAPTNKSARIINGQTIHKFVISSSRKSMTDAKIDYIFIDEISMVQESFYKFFIIMKRLRPELKFIIAGDFEQLLPVNDRVDCDYKTSPALHELADGNRLQLSKCRRADDILYNLCNPKNIPMLKKSQFTKSNDELYMNNLAFTNRKRIEINKKMMDLYINEHNVKPLLIKAKKNDEHSQDVKLIKGMPIIARCTRDKLGILNNEMFTIESIDEEHIEITNDEQTLKIEINEFSNLFYVAFCITVHKSQGCTFNTKYQIHQWELFDYRLKYVALSRSSNIDYIHIA